MHPEEPHVIETELLVIGSGAAGLRAAIAAKECGASVILVTKGLPGRSGCTQMAAHSSSVGPWIDPSDSSEIFVSDVIRSGAFLGDRDLIEIVVQESKDRIAELERWGAVWNRRADGSIETYQIAGHSYPRTFTSRGRIGRMILNALLQQARRMRLEIRENIIALKLLKDSRDTRVIGAFTLDFVSGRFIVFLSKATILATGSYGMVYSPTTAAKEDTGDGHVMALKAGASLIDMEHTIFLPAGELNVGQKWGKEGVTPKLLNALEKRFMEKYNPKGGEFATKEIVMPAVLREIKEGRGTPSGGVYVDLRDLPWDEQIVRDFYSSVVETESLFGNNPRKGLIEARPTAHTPIGGIIIDSEGRTEVPGLYAAGACAGGVYGIARISGFTTMASLVFGRRAGMQAAKEVQELEETTQPVPWKTIQEEKNEVMSLLQESLGSSKTVTSLRQQLQLAMMERAGPIKDEKDLNECLALITKLIETDFALQNKSLEHNLELAEAIELRNMLRVAYIVVRCCIERKESRGSFLREDYPETDEQLWRKNIVCGQIGESNQLDIKFRIPNSDTKKQQLGNGSRTLDPKTKRERKEVDL
jgi:fumarate reductase (CoM/CoB) subunit A